MKGVYNIASLKKYIYDAIHGEVTLHCKTIICEDKELKSFLQLLISLEEEIKLEKKRKKREITTAKHENKGAISSAVAKGQARP